jgi:hypothetical protein
MKNLLVLKQLVTLKQLAALIISCVLFSATAFGHGGSHNPIPPAKALIVATNVANQFTTMDPGLGFGQLSKSWLNLPAAQSSLHKKGKGYYIVKLDNSEEKKSLFVLMAITGEVYDANFSGEFENLK